MASKPARGSNSKCFLFYTCYLLAVILLFDFADGSTYEKFQVAVESLTRDMEGYDDCFVKSEVDKIWKGFDENRRILNELSTNINVATEDVKQPSGAITAFQVSLEHRVLALEQKMDILLGKKNRTNDIGSLSCTLPNGTRLELLQEVVIPDLCGFDNLTCTLDGLKPTVPGLAIADFQASSLMTCCSAPFKMTSVGCIYVDKSVRTWCEARTFCRGLRTSSLYSAPTSNDTLALIDYLHDTYGGRQFWAGANRAEDGSWRFQGGIGRLVTWEEWHRSEPSNKEAEACTYTGVYAGLFDVSCTGLRHPLCHADVPECVMIY